MPQQPQQPVDIGLGLKIFPSKTVAEARADLDEQELAKQDRDITRMKLADYVEQRNAQRAKAQEDQEFNAFLTDASQKFVQKDGSPDDDRILVEVSKRYPARAPALKAIVLKQRKDAIDAYKVSLDNDKAEHDADLQRLQQMGTPQAYAAFYPALKDPYLKQYLGPQFDETTPTKIKAMYDAGLSEKDRLDRQRQTADLYDKNPHLAFLRNLSDDTDEEMPHTIAAARRLIPDAVDAFLEELQPNQPGVQQRAKQLAEVLAPTTEKSGGTDFERALPVYATSIGKTVGELTWKDRLTASRQFHDAQREPQGSGVATPVEQPIDATSQNILSQTGLSLNAFRSLVDPTVLPRDAATRKAAAAEADKWARAHNVDVATLRSQYQSYNKVLSANIERLNNTKIMESELQGTIDNLRSVVKDADLGRLNAANVVKIWAGQEVNDKLAQQYALHLGQLRNELTAYYAATQGRTGNNLTLQDAQDAKEVIKNGISAGSLSGLKTAIENSTSKMGTVMQGSVDRTRKAVWDLFGVGGNFQKPETPGTSGLVRVKGKDGKTYEFPNQAAADAFKKAGGE